MGVRVGGVLLPMMKHKELQQISPQKQFQVIGEWRIKEKSVQAKSLCRVKISFNKDGNKGFSRLQKERERMRICHQQSSTIRHVKKLQVERKQSGMQIRIYTMNREYQKW